MFLNYTKCSVINYIIKCFNFQAYASKIFARMIQVQLRYFQYILSVAIFAGIVISSTPLISACFVGLTLIWLTEMLVGQFDINTEKFYVVLVLLLIAFSTVSIKSLSPDTNLSYLFVGALVMAILYFLLQPDINIYKVGNSLLATVIAMLVNGFIIGSVFQENIIYVSFMMLLLLFLKTLATYFNIQFGNFQFFFNFFLVFIIFSGISSFYDFVMTYVLIAAAATALFTTFLTFMFIKIRYEYELTSKLSNQIYIFDYLFAFICSLYIVDSLNVINGLF